MRGIYIDCWKDGNKYNKDLMDATLEERQAYYKTLEPWQLIKLIEFSITHIQKSQRRL